MQTFDACSFKGNLDLCGEPLNRSCPEDDITSKPQGPAVHGEDENSVFYESIYFSMGLGFFRRFSVLLVSILLWHILNNLTDYIIFFIGENPTCVMVLQYSDI